MKSLGIQKLRIILLLKMSDYQEHYWQSLLCLIPKMAILNKIYGGGGSGKLSFSVVESQSPIPVSFPSAHYYKQVFPQRGILLSLWPGLFMFGLRDYYLCILLYFHQNGHIQLCIPDAMFEKALWTCSFWMKLTPSTETSWSLET